MIYEGKNALVLGLGESGLAMALWLARSGARVRVADTRESPDRLPALREALPDAEFVAGPLAAALLEGVDFVAVSPGLAPGRELAEIMPAATAAGVPVWGEIELFAQALEALENERAYKPKIIAITGTNRSRLSAIEQLIFFWLNVSDADAKTDTSLACAIIAASMPFSLGTNTG